MGATVVASAYLFLALAAFAAHGGEATASSAQPAPFSDRAQSYVPQGWVRRGRESGDAWVPLTLAVTQPGAAQLAATCRYVSDPTSAHYGEYVTLDALTQLLGARGNHDAVVAWLRGVGARDIQSTATLDFVSASMRVGTVEAAFAVEMHVHERVGVRRAGPRRGVPVRQQCVRATTHPTLPLALDSVADLVMGVSDFPLDPPRRAHHPTAETRLRRDRRQAPNLRAGRGGRHAAAVFPAPDVSYEYVSDTEAKYVLTQTCAGATTATATTARPCANTSQPVTKYQSMCNYNGRVPTDIPWDNVVLQCSYANDGCSYLVTVPHTYSPGQLVNCSFRAVTSDGASAWATLPWQNVPADSEQLITTPLVTPPFMHDFYGLPPAPATAGATQAVAAFTGNYYMPSDLSTFYTMYNVSHTGELLQHGQNLPQYPKPEGTLDIEWLTATAPSADTTFWYQEGNTTTRRGTFVLGLAMAVSDDPNPPMLFSVSYGGTETFFTKLAGPQYIPRCNVEFQKMCARGITIVAAAGDAGATSFGHGSESCTIDAYFPGSSPWVTAVSATFVSRSARPRPNPGAGGAGEAAVTVGNYIGWSTGGGFSNEPTCEQPWYQKAAVAEYLARDAPGMAPPGTYNASLRAYPDVAALGHNVMTVTDGIVEPADGTSAATPMIAGILTRLNQARIAKGLPQIGLANPLLYAARHDVPAAFYDIEGPANNKCGSYVCCPNGFEVTPGFDAVTGLGAVGDYATLEAYAVSAAARADAARAQARL